MSEQVQSLRHMKPDLENNPTNTFESKMRNVPFKIHIPLMAKRIITIDQLLKLLNEKIADKLMEFVEEELNPYIENEVRKACSGVSIIPSIDEPEPTPISKPADKPPSTLKPSEKDDQTSKRCVSQSSENKASQKTETGRYMSRPSAKEVEKHMNTNPEIKTEGRYISRPPVNEVEKTMKSNPTPAPKASVSTSDQPKTSPQPVSNRKFSLVRYSEKAYVILGPTNDSAYTAFVTKVLKPLKTFTWKPHGIVHLIFNDRLSSIKKELIFYKIPYASYESKEDYESALPSKEPPKKYLDVNPKKNKFGNMEADGFVFSKIENDYICVGTQNASPLTKTSWESVWCLTEDDQRVLDEKGVRWFDPKNAALVGAAKRQGQGLYTKIITLQAKLLEKQASSSSSSDESSSGESSEEENEGEETNDEDESVSEDSD